MNKGLKGLPPNFRKFFEGEFKRLINGKGKLGADPVYAINEVIAKGVKAMEQDIKDDEKVNDDIRSLDENSENVIKESGSKEPIR